MSLSERERRILADIEGHLTIRPPGAWWRLAGAVRRAPLRSWLTGALICAMAIAATALVGVALVDVCSAIGMRVAALGELARSLGGGAA